MGLFDYLDRRKTEDTLTVPLMGMARGSQHAIDLSASTLAAMRGYGACGPPSIATKGLGTDVDLSMFTTHGKGLIDFVLAYRPLEMNATQQLYREVFEAKLRERGLYLEYEDMDQSQDGKTCFVKVHAPWDTLARMAEINRLKLPIQRGDQKDPDDMPKTGRIRDRINAIFHLEPPYDIPEQAPYFTLEFQRNKFRQFLIQDPNTFFTQIQRIEIVWDIIQRTNIHGSDMQSNGHDEGIEGQGFGDTISANYLLRKGVYTAAFPLHDSDLAIKQKPTKLWPLRVWLVETWARPGRILKCQPLDQIRAYLGEKIALYFAWLGFYTCMLVPFSIAGVLVFLYGLLYLPHDIPYKDVCHGNVSQSIICRKCGSSVCPYTILVADCMHAGATAMFNNFSTVFFSLFAALWSVVFLELWKRKQAALSCKWDTFELGHEYEPPRPDYVAQAKTKRRNPITQEWEPHVPTRSRMQNLLASVASVSFLICVVIAVVFGVIVYKVIMVSLYSRMGNPAINAMGSDMFTTATASLLNAILIMVLEKIYNNVAWKLTVNEFPRTDTDFETSYTYKMYIFQFVNYYATLFYLAFFNQAFAGTPEDDTLLTDRCPPTGCMFNVTTQLAIILIVKQTVNNVMELGVPWVTNWLRRRKSEKATTDSNTYTRYEKDFDLMGLDELPLFGEYFEMVMQFGFVTMFVAAFPLAPLFALINNVVEIRLDAYKFVVCARRALPRRAANIGNWYEILEFVSRLSVLTNGLMIAFTTDLIDRFVYMTSYSSDGSLNGYMNWTLAVFNTADWNDPSLMTDSRFGVVETCRYHGQYNPSSDSAPYWYNDDWWRIMLAKLAFVLLFEHIVFITMGVIQYVVPDVPEHVSLHMQRSRYLAKVTAYKSEMSRSGATSRKSTIEPLMSQSRSASIVIEPAHSPTALSPPVGVNHLEVPATSKKRSLSGLFKKEAKDTPNSDKLSIGSNRSKTSSIASSFRSKGKSKK